MTFEIEEFTKARLEDIEVLSQKNRQPDEAPGVKLHLEMTVSNHVLSTLDGALKGMLFTRKDGAPNPVVTKKKDNQTATLDNVEPVSDLPNLSHIGAHVKSLRWSVDVTGCAAVIRFATTELGLDDCACGPFKIKPKEGGTCEIKFPLEAPNASEKVFAKLAKYKSREIEFKVRQHGPAEDPQRKLVDDAKDPPGTKDPKKVEPSEPRGGPVGDSIGDPWPFPKNGAAAGEAPPQSATVEKPGRKGRRAAAEVE